MGTILNCSVIYFMKNKERDNWIPHNKNLGIPMTTLGKLYSVFFSSFENKIKIKATIILMYMTI